MAYELIETVEVGAGGASSIEFTSIPQDGVDLVLKLSCKSEASSGFARLDMKFSGLTSNYSRIDLYGDGSSAFSSSASSQGATSFTGAAGSLATDFGNLELYFSNYTSGAVVSCDYVTEDNASSAFQGITATSNSSATSISSILLSVGGGHDFAQYSTASLYKIY